ncbi:MAG: RNA polymerase sigma factor [Clostridiales bacterium]|nr:RNA polymerase sigma factor [Clostridiales bacterium]
MFDERIIEMYFERNQDAIVETDNKYGRYLNYISFNILRSRLSAEECVNDTYQKAWDNIPPKRPERLSTFLGKITRNLSISRLSYENAQKRNRKTDLLLSELEDCIPDNKGDFTKGIELKDAINGFLETLSRQERIVFVRRYWYASSIKEIGEAYGLKESLVKVNLFRMRKKLKEYLEKEGISI